MPKHKGWKGNKFKIGNFVMVKFNVKKSGKYHKISVITYIRDVFGVIKDKKVEHYRFKTIKQLEDFIQKLKSETSENWFG